MHSICLQKPLRTWPFEAYECKPSMDLAATPRFSSSTVVRIFFIHKIENLSWHQLCEFFFNSYFSTISKMVPNLNLPSLFTIWSLN